MKSLWLVLLLVFVGQTATAKVAPATLDEFNKTCPTPKLCETLDKNLDACESGDQATCKIFVANYRKALPEYDCQRPFDVTPTEKYTVPAIWLCDGHEKFLNALAKMKSPEARKLYGSKALRASLDGALAEGHLRKSERIDWKRNKASSK